MSLKDALFTPDEQERLFDHTFLQREKLEEQYATLEQQHETAAFGMWVFLATEVMFFGTLFISVYVYRAKSPEAVEAASVHLNWLIGGINTLVLLVSSLMMKRWPCITPGTAIYAGWSYSWWERPSWACCFCV